MATINHKTYNEGTETFKDFSVYDGKDTLIFKVDGADQTVFATNIIGGGSIKTSDNSALSGTLKALSDGLGNDSALALSTGAATITGTLGVSNRLSLTGVGTSELYTADASGMYLTANTAAGMYLATEGAFIFRKSTAPFTEYARILNTGNVGIGTSSPSTTLDVLGTSFLRGNVNAGKTSNINVTTAVNGVGGGNREFDTFTGASATGFTGTDASDQGHGYFAATIVAGRSYEVSATMVVTNGIPLSFITTTGLNFATQTVQTVQGSPVSGTTYRFVASGNASYFGVAASNSGGGMTCVVSNFSLKEVGSVLVTSDSNVGVGTTAPAVKLDVIGNIRSSSGILFGSDTAAANALDDYEEGTWTMGVAFGGAAVGVTYSSNTGTYTKIGRQVTVNGWIVMTSKGSSTGTAAITGLPFAIGSASSNYAPASFRLGFMTYTGIVQGYGGTGGTTIPLEDYTEAGSVGDITDADFSNGTNIMLSFTYFV